MLGVRKKWDLLCTVRRERCNAVLRAKYDYVLQSVMMMGGTTSNYDDDEGISEL